MRDTDIVIKSLDRETMVFYGDNKIVHGGTTKNYDIDFLIIINETVIESSLKTEYDGELSFDIAKEIIQEILCGDKIK